MENFFRYVCCEQKEIKKLDMEQIARMVRRCCEIKAGVVERDPKEQGERALLNLGHTVGHAVENLRISPCSTDSVWESDWWQRHIFP